MKTNWTKQFLEQHGFDFILQAFINKPIGGAIDSTVSNFSEVASTKDISFLMTLLRVFLQAGFSSQEGGAIGQAIMFVRKSSSIRNDDGSSARRGGGATD